MAIFCYNKPLTFMPFSRKKNFIFLFICVGIFSFSLILTGLYHYRNLALAPYSKNVTYSNISSKVESVVLPKETIAPPTHILNPAIIKAVYVTGWSAGSKKYQAYLDGLFATGKINAVVIDVKDSSGIVSYKTQAPKAKEYGAYYPKIKDVEQLIKDLHQKGIYVIGRITLFEDPALAKARPDLAVYENAKTTDFSKPVLWQDNNGLSWVDPASKEVIDYNIEIAREALLYGFDEINFDYVRFPSDGPHNTMGFPKWDTKTPKHIIIKEVFGNLREALPDAILSVDVFGQTTTNTDDLGIGQIFEDALGYFDYICPMVYPSHYVAGFLGYQNPAEHPYQVVSYATGSAIARKKVYDAVQGSNPPPGGKKPAVSATIRPWLQDFNLGATYDATMVSEQVRAVLEATGTDFKGFMLWNASNIYTKEALL